jgi:hypothetical protein
MTNFSKRLAKLSLSASLAVLSVSAFADVTKVMTIESAATTTMTECQRVELMLFLKDVTKV